MRFAKIAYHDYEGVAVNLEERQRLVQDLGELDGMILRNHGLLACGSIPEAFNAIFRLERACQVQVAALSCNTELSCRRRTWCTRPGASSSLAAASLRPAGMARPAAQARQGRPVLQELTRRPRPNRITASGDSSAATSLSSRARLASQPRGTCRPPTTGLWLFDGHRPAHGEAPAHDLPMDEARARYVDPEPVPNSLEVREVSEQRGRGEVLGGKTKA